MSDTIKRSESIAKIKEYANNHAFNSFHKGMLKACEILAQLPSADRPQGWIPCSERLPSNFGKDETVLATTDVDGRRVVLMLATDVERFYLKGYVSAWMPSPKPWEGADDGE